jgi:hypothetical protein
LSSIHANELETRGGRGGGRGGAGAGTAQDQDKAEMRKGWVAWMEEIPCGFEGSREGQAAAAADGLDHGRRWPSPTISFEISAPEILSSSSSSSWESEWKQHASSRQLCMMPFYQQVAHQVYAANAADMSMSATSAKSMAGGEQERNRRGGGVVEQQKELSQANWGQEVGLMGAYVANLPRRRDRLQHTRKLLGETMVFGNISTVRSMPSLSLQDAQVSASYKLKHVHSLSNLKLEHNAQRLVSSEGVHVCSMLRYVKNGVDAAGSSIANALSHVEWLQLLAAEHRAQGPLFEEENHTFAGWFEDDVLAASGAAEVRQRIREALARLPPSADMLYVEASWETCEELMFDEHKPGIVRTVRPSGSTAIFFTRKGILKAAEILEGQPWHCLDLMYAHAVSVGLLEAYITMTPCFLKDGFLGSDFKRELEMTNVFAGVIPGGGEANDPQVANGQHGLDHPAVVVDSPVLECECKETWSPSLHELSSTSTCEHSVVLIVSVRGLAPQFVYEVEIKWSLESEKLTHTWRSVVKTETDCYTFREPLVQRNDDFLFGMMAWDTYKNGNDRFCIEVTVCDMYPGLTTKEALVGIRNIDSSVNAVELKCAEQKSHGNGGTFPTHLAKFVLQSDADSPATGLETNAAIIMPNHTLKNSGHWPQPGNRGNDQQERQVVEKLDTIGFDHRNPPSLLMHNDKKHLDTNFASSEDFQERLWDWQHPRSCVDSKLMIISWRHDSGLGSQLHLRAFNFVLGLNNNRVVVDDPGFPFSFGPVYKGAAVSDQNDSHLKEFCRSPQSFDCFFLPLSNCTVPLNVATHGAVKATVQNIASDERWVYLDGPDWMSMESFGFRGLSLKSKIFGQRSKSSHWWFSQLIRYIVRPNRFTVKYIMKPAFLSVFPNGPPSDLASLFIRLGDRHKESDIPSIESHFEHLVNPSLNITNLYVGSDSQKAIDEVISQYGQKFKIFYLKVERFRDGMTWETYTGIQKHTQLQQSGMNPLMILNISLMQLYLSVQGKFMFGHLGSNWCRIEHELHDALGMAHFRYHPVGTCNRGAGAIGFGDCFGDSF